jgi:hypothetical protein
MRFAKLPKDQLGNLHYLQSLEASFAATEERAPLDYIAHGWLDDVFQTEK